MADPDTPVEAQSPGLEAGQAVGYQVVARRYRPQTFDELIGQEHVAKALKQAISSGRVGHAYLFTGARGVGKTSAARVLAKALNCVNGPTTEPCNKCEICQAITSGDDVDTMEIDAASNTGVDNIRDLRQNANVRASRCRYKIYIVDEVHMLSKSAFNALLKTLEEPPEHVKFIFATTEPDKIPITILSRCQRFDFAGIEASSIASRLSQIAEKEGVEIDDEALAVLSIRAAGSMRDSQSLLEQLLAVAGSKITAQEVYTLLGTAPGERIAQLVESIIHRDAAAAIANLDSAIVGGADVGQLVDQLLGYFRDVMAMVVGCDTSQLRYVLPSQYEQTRELGSKLGIHTVLAMIQVLDQTVSRMRGSLHTRTLAEMAVVRLAHLDDLDNLAAAVAELRATEPASAGATGVKKNVSPPPVTPPQSTAPPTPAPAPPTPTPPVAPTPATPPPAPAATNGNAAAHRVDPPAPTAPRAPVTLTSEAVKAAWESVAANLEGLLASQVEQAHEVKLEDGDKVLVCFAPGDQFSLDMCQQPANQQRLERSLAEQLGAVVSLKFEIDQSIKVETPQAKPVRPVSQRQLQSEVAERPFVVRAMELFNTDISKLKVTPPRSGKKQ
ncbi:DNA polymerase III subunit gamma/tau [Aeoliella sp.]|uniref:DNA polymerase III subunit gamma/tau n=1 Tax=Aeoliella sp. TaxID=2795800 RepID=UPI003CCB9228